MCSCEQEDLGFALPDERDRIPLKAEPCGECAGCCEGDDCVDIDREYVTIRIIRVWAQCPRCQEGTTWYPRFVVACGGKDVATLTTEQSAWNFVQAEYGDRIDERAAQADAELAAEYAAERRFGC